MITISTLTNADKIEPLPNEAQNAYSFSVWYINPDIAYRYTDDLRELGFDVSAVNTANVSVIVDLNVYSTDRRNGVVEAKEMRLQYEGLDVIYLQHDDGNHTLHFDLKK